MINQNPDIKKRQVSKKLGVKQYLVSLEVVALAIVSAMLLGGIYYSVAIAQSTSLPIVQETAEPDSARIEQKVTYKKTVVRTITTKVTGYNTVPEQTDSTPCIASSGKNICGRKDVAACPRNLATGTLVEIDGKEYKCLDILAEKFDERFDISCDKDMTCPFKITGTKTVKIIKYEPTKE